MRGIVIVRRDTLEEALGEIEADRLTGASSIVVNLQWWTGLSIAEQEDYRLRADRAQIELVADDALSSHYVVVRGVDEGPALSTERPESRWRWSVVRAAMPAGAPVRGSPVPAGGSPARSRNDRRPSDARTAGSY